MAEVRDPASEMEAAELAAGAGDFTSAEQHLNRAVELEEASFGPMHAELASILNNLGVVYERLDRPDKAEACYRRAYGVAKASLPPGDPGIELSAANLREFCAARGIPFEPSAFAPGATADKPPSAQGASASAPAGATADKTADKARREGCADIATELLADGREARRGRSQEGSGRTGAPPCLRAGRGVRDLCSADGAAYAGDRVARGRRRDCRGDLRRDSLLVADQPA